MKATKKTNMKVYFWVGSDDLATAKKFRKLSQVVSSDGSYEFIFSEHLFSFDGKSIAVCHTNMYGDCLIASTVRNMIETNFFTL